MNCCKSNEVGFSYKELYIVSFNTESDLQLILVHFIGSFIKILSIMSKSSFKSPIITSTTIFIRSVWCFPA